MLSQFSTRLNIGTHYTHLKLQSVNKRTGNELIKSLIIKCYAFKMFKVNKEVLGVKKSRNFNTKQTQLPQFVDMSHNAVVVVFE